MATADRSRARRLPSQEISADYIVQLFRHLQSAELVRGVKEFGGGYRLARDATKIGAGDVVQAVECQVAVVHCALPGPDGEPACNCVDRCVDYLLWKRPTQAMADMLGSVTLRDLADQVQQLFRGEGQV